MLRAFSQATLEADIYEAMQKIADDTPELYSYVDVLMSEINTSLCGICSTAVCTRRLGR